MDCKLMMQITFITLLADSGQELVTSKQVSQLHNVRHPGVLQLAPIFALKPYAASKMHAIPIEHNIFDSRQQA